MEGRTMQEDEYIPVDHDRSVAVALVLTLLFGPIGVLYVSRPGGAIFMAAAIWIGLATWMVGVAALWPLAMAYAGVKALNDHRRFMLNTAGLAPVPPPVRVPQVGAGS
ncbi:MAG: hypothetical protein ACYCST_09875 [Acidimicrobiales bacterium]